ncbi:MAG: nicotinate (nicotinamide) nucleotide adenylyltransferase [Bacillota bacterium]|nr:nicotinate (nicotinamide) nucleotide adenylyltransferase [Bacillota bacterium]
MKIGILGGSFSPVHNGHIFLAGYIRENCRLDKVIMIPNGIHPFAEKQNMPDAVHRLRMLELAVEGIEGIEVSDIEVRSPGVSYTYITLCRLRETFGKDCTLYFIIGTDELLELERWYEAGRLLKEFSFIVGIRPGYSMETVGEKINELKNRFGADIRIINLPAPDVSSTEIREAVGKNGDLTGLIPERVNEYIKANGLYK